MTEGPADERDDEASDVMTGPRIAIADIETFPILAYTWSLFKPIIGIEQIKEQPRIAGVGWQWHGERDVKWYGELEMGQEAMLRQLYELMDEADIIVGWNSQGFDVPHLNAAFVKYGWTPPSPFAQVDLMRVARKRFRLPSYKLDYVAQYLGVGKKIKHAGFSMWIRCMNNDPVAWRQMGTYCKRDVRITGLVYDKLKVWAPNHPNMGLYDDDAEGVLMCAGCKSTDLRRDGYRYTSVAKYPRYQCRSCGKWGQEKKSVAIVEGRGVPS